MNPKELVCKHCSAPLVAGNPMCPECRLFNVAPRVARSETAFMSLADVEDEEEHRLGQKEWWSYLLSGGLVLEQCVLIAGRPGCGKSTWAKQVGAALYKETRKKALYLASEEGVKAVKAATRRLGLNPNAFAIPLEAQDSSFECLDEEEEFSVVIIDSVPDFIGQDLQEGVELLKRVKEYCVERQTPAIAIAHVTQDEDMAGLMRWQHIVDTTVQVESFEDKQDRFLKTTGKNRFGAGHKTIHCLMMDMEDKYPGRLYPHPKWVQMQAELEEKKNAHLYRGKTKLTPSKNSYLAKSDALLGKGDLTAVNSVAEKKKKKG